MRKIPYDLENPIDNIILQYGVEPIQSFLYKLRITPNTITVIGLFFGLMSSYYFNISRYNISASLWFLSYYMDCIDGYYARTYNMETEFGDFLDHTSDLFKSIIMVYLMYKKDRKKLLKIIFYLSIPFVLMLIHLGCQQRLKNGDKKELLDVLSNFCPNTSYIHFFKYFGSGTVIIIFSICILLWDKI